MESYYKTKSLFKLVIKWKWHLLVMVAVAFILAAIFSSPWFIKPKYKSTATLLPANIVVQSDESEAEQMLELIQSTDIKFRIIESFDLASHYEVNPDDPNYINKLLKFYDGNISFQKTPNDAIVISVVDEDPQMASDIADSIISFYNQTVLEMNAIKSKEVANIYYGTFLKKQKEVDSLANVLKQYSLEHGLLDLSTQVEKYTEALYMGKSLNEARTVLDNWKEYGAEFQKTDSLYCYAIADLQRNKNIYENALRDAHKEQTYSHVISKPFPADKKSYPVRWLIVLFSVMGALLAGVIIISIIEGNKKQ